ncbi:MAG: hypothetical protein K1X94_26205 [Sandaracinaceae bacterium]|nr:hypothetical protein [Sandaracinaceae bacterium]
MKRRLLLGSSLTSLALGPFVGALRAFAQDRPPEDALLAGLSEAYRAAQRAHRPLLVLVIPEDNAARWDRGGAFGSLILHGPDEALLALGVAELACATPAALRQLVPQAPAGEPLLVLVDPSSVPASVRALDAPLPPMPTDWNASDAVLDDAIDRRIGTLATLLHEGLGARVAALAAAERDAARQRTVGSLRTHRIRGSYWATDDGCGVYVEEAPLVGGYDCGMGHVPPRARRFLHFFAVARP